MVPIEQNNLYDGFQDSFTQLDEITRGERLAQEKADPVYVKPDTPKQVTKEKSVSTPVKGPPIRNANTHISKKARSDKMVRLVEKNPIAFDQVFEVQDKLRANKEERAALRRRLAEIFANPSLYDSSQSCDEDPLLDG